MRRTNAQYYFAARVMFSFSVYLSLSLSLPFFRLTCSYVLFHYNTLRMFDKSNRWNGGAHFRLKYQLSCHYFSQMIRFPYSKVYIYRYFWQYISLASHFWNYLFGAASHHFSWLKLRSTEEYIYMYEIASEVVAKFRAFDIYLKASDKITQRNGRTLEKHDSCRKFARQAILKSFYYLWISK